MLDPTMERLANPSHTLSHKLLRTLSGLNKDDLVAFRQGWPEIGVDRRRHITVALVEMAEDDSALDFEDVFRILMNDADEQVRATAISGLWETNDQRFVDPLIEILQQDASPQVRAAAAEVLGHFGMLGAENKLHGGRAQRLLDALLNTFHNLADPLNTIDVRRNSLESASFFSDDERVIAAINEAYAHPDISMRASAISAMGFTFDSSWEPIVLDELVSPEPELRFEAARAAGDLWLENAVPRLVKMVKDPDPEVRLMAVWSLGEIGGMQAKATLTELLESNNEEMREAAEEALEDLRFNESPLGFDDLLNRPKGNKPK